jgi:hypothetical protein
VFVTAWTALSSRMSRLEIVRVQRFPGVVIRRD